MQSLCHGDCVNNVNGHRHAVKIEVFHAASRVSFPTLGFRADRSHLERVSPHTIVVRDRGLSEKVPVGYDEYVD